MVCGICKNLPQKIVGLNGDVCCKLQVLSYFLLQDALIERLTQYLADLGHSVADILQQVRELHYVAANSCYY